MDEAIHIPEPVSRCLPKTPYIVDDIGCSGSTILLYSDVVLKIQPISEESQRERIMMDWLRGRLPVPKLLAWAEEKGLQYLLMNRISGEMSCSPSALRSPKKTVELLAQGLKMLWSVDISDCPVVNNLDVKLQESGERVRQGLVSVEDAEPDTYGPGRFSHPQALHEYLRNNRSQEELCLAHGDYCLPNIFFQGAGVSGFIDLGRSGIADRWQDIALCVRSLKYNFGGVDYSRWLFEALEVEPDMDKIRYFILLDELF